MLARVARFVNVLGLELVGGILVLTLGAWIFGLTVEELSDGDTHLDTRFAAWLHEHATEGSTTFFENVTRLGNVPVLAAVTLVAAIVLARKRLTSELELLLLAAIGAEILSVGLKLGFERERPFFSDPLATESTYSFPSGHASVSLAVYGTIGYIAGDFGFREVRRSAWSRARWSRSRARRSTTSRASPTSTSTARPPSPPAGS